MVWRLTEREADGEKEFRIGCIARKRIEVVYGYRWSWV